MQSIGSFSKKLFAKGKVAAKKVVADVRAKVKREAAKIVTTLAKKAMARATRWVDDQVAKIQSVVSSFMTKFVLINSYRRVYE